MTMPVIGNLWEVDAQTVAERISKRLQRLPPDEPVAYVFVDRRRNVQLMRQTIRGATMILASRADELVGTYTRCVSSPAMLALIAGDLAEAMK